MMPWMPWMPNLGRLEEGKVALPSTLQRGMWYGLDCLGEVKLGQAKIPKFIGKNCLMHNIMHQS